MIKKLLYTIITILIAACSNDKEYTSFIDPGNKNANKGDKYATRIEVPALKEDGIFIAHCTTVAGKENVTYSIEHVAERKHCRWTAFTFDQSNRAKNWNRNNWDNTEWKGDPFQHNPELPRNYVFTKDEINKNGYVRGHIVASSDRLYSKYANEQTFYYSNISPMLSSFNTGLWNDLEMLLQGWGRNSDFCDTLYVVKGGTIREGEYKKKGSCITIPNHYYMALLCRYKGTYKAIAFWFEHKSYLGGKLSDYTLSIDQLEENTGIDFFCNLPDKLENTVERQYYISNWRGLK